MDLFRHSGFNDVGAIGYSEAAVVMMSLPTDSHFCQILARIRQQSDLTAQETSSVTSIASVVCIGVGRNGDGIATD